MLHSIIIIVLSESLQGMATWLIATLINIIWSFYVALSLSTDMGHHFKVSQCLKDLPNEDLISLGGALGLSFPKLKRMRDLPSEMVAAWLRKEDDVLKQGKPTWKILVNALRDIGQNGIANSILQKVQA